MTDRERFRETMRGGVPDRVPYFEEGLREAVLERWHEQGLAPDADLAEIFHTDRRERLPVNLEPLPALKRWPRSRRGLAALRRRLRADDPRRLPEDWDERAVRWRTRDHVLEFQLHRGFFLSMGVGDWRRFAEVICLIKDAPALLREMMDIVGEFTARLAERVLDEVEVDFVSFSEPIGGNEGPVISPAQYREFVLSSYAPALEVVRARGVETVCFTTYANAQALIPSVLDAGFNCLWACEVNTGAMDYRALRREFGRELRLIGGIDLDTLLLGKEAIRAEILQKVPPLLAQGRYVPLADGRVRANVPFENYAYYRRLLEEVTQG